jgi:hypothetical protein
MPNLGDTVIYSATISPGGATSPTYSWSIAPSNAGTINGSNNNSTVSVTWTLAGNHNVDLTVNGCNSSSASDSNPINVIAPLLSWEVQQCANNAITSRVLYTNTLSPGNVIVLDGDNQCYEVFGSGSLLSPLDTFNGANIYSNCLSCP